MLGFLQFILERPGTVSHIYLRTPSGTVHHGPYADHKGNPILHVDLAKKHGLPDSGAAHTKLERGVIHVDHDKKRVRAYTKSEFGHVHNDVVKHFHKHYPSTQNYDWQDHT